MKKRAALCLLLSLAAVPIFAAVDAEITVPVAGNLVMPSGLRYGTEFTVTNHRDVVAQLRLDLISDGQAQFYGLIGLDPHETKFFQVNYLGGGNNNRRFIGAMRFTSIKPVTGIPFDSVLEPEGRIQVDAVIVADRGRDGSTRQEMPGVAKADYNAEEAVFVGVQHTTYLYTNVGITNLDPNVAQTFLIEFQYHEPVTVTIPPNTLGQVRIAQPEQGGRFVRVIPQWSLDHTTPRPWVSYASTVDTITGDAYSGTRVPKGTTFEP